MIAAIKPYFNLARADKPIGIFLLLWPTLWALWASSQGSPQLKIVLLFLLGTIVMRSAGCVVNDFADREFDKHVERTRNRPLTAKQISVKNALIFFAILLSLALLIVLQLNVLCLELAFVGLGLTVLYPYLKRVTHLPQLGLGFAFSWGVPMAFAAQTGEVSHAGWMMYAAAIIWPLIYDTMYAMADRADDLKIGLKSTAILFGQSDRLILGLLQCVFITLLAYMGGLFQFTLPYYLGLTVAAGLFIYQQVLIKDREPKLCFAAFINNNWVGFVIFVGIILGITL